ncbi:hypothetical protein UFOVP353_53 [uncultured Caudovirales phage]|uniref:Uncharacterized protein n=1 Tax=uncultured Caudovirales phage TaxID=2100421 RepID=A0A6J5M495_9CAUD|nr:hypothetical protein UFOVP353_53 [uncultured Caudovirales phage]
MTNQGLRQQSVRDATSTAYDYNGDWHALFDAAGIADGEFNGRMLAWINQSLSASYTNINEAMVAYAVSQGVTNFSSLGSFSALSPYSLPSYFPVSAPFTIYGSGVNGYSTDIDLDDLRPTGLTVGYISSSGNDGTASNGNISLPYATISGAITGGARELVFLNGGPFALAAFAPSYNLIMRRNTGVTTPVYIRNTLTTPVTWTQEISPNTNVWSGTIASGTVGNVLDTTANVTTPANVTQIDGATGVHRPLLQLTSVATVQATPGSFWQNGTTLYVHAWDSLQPVTANIMVLDNSTVFAVSSPAASATIWMEGLEIWGSMPFRWITGTGGALARHYARDCGFRYANGSTIRCLRNEGATSIYQRCKATHSNDDDAFSYSPNVAASYIPLHCEIDCEGLFGGYNTTGNTDNGSTVHAQAHAIRINGLYGYGYGGNVVDVQGSHTISLGTRAVTSFNGDAGVPFGFGAGQSSASWEGIHWIKDVSSTGSTRSLQRSTGGNIINLGGLAGTGSTSGTIIDGTVQANIDAIFIPANTVAPSFTGTQTSGSLLTGSAGTWTGNPVLTQTQQWQRSPDGTNWSPIVGGTALNYTLQAADVGNRVRLTVTNSTGIRINTSLFASTTANSSSSGVIA